MKATIKIILILLVLLVFQSCSKDDTPTTPPVIEETNNAPSINAQTFTVDENIADNIPIGEVVASDLDDDALAFSISANDGVLFEISEAGVLSLDDLQLLDFETTQSHTITVQVSDGTTSTEALITINVTDIDDTSFVTTWVTSSANETVTIPTRADEYTYDYTIDWGDGTIQSGRTGDVTHSYEVSGTYAVLISGVFPAISMAKDPNSVLRTVERWGNIEWLSMEGAFSDVALTINAVDTPNLSQVSSMRRMFFFSETLSGDLSKWDVSNVLDMRGMFKSSAFNQDIGDWDVSNATDMERMFQDSEFNKDIRDWDVANVTICDDFSTNAPLTPANTPNFTNCTF